MNTLWFKVETNLMNKKKKKEIEEYSLDLFVADLGCVWFQRIEASKCAQIDQIKQRVGEEGFRLCGEIRVGVGRWAYALKGRWRGSSCPCLIVRSNVAICHHFVLGPWLMLTAPSCFHYALTVQSQQSLVATIFIEEKWSIGSILAFVTLIYAWLSDFGDWVLRVAK